jgi:hypothetical protein
MGATKGRFANCQNITTETDTTRTVPTKPERFILPSHIFRKHILICIASTIT